MALEIATQVAAGLAAVHKQKLVHRDIKPSNIMVSVEEGGALTAKIIDLGLAETLPTRLLEAAISSPGLLLVHRSSPVRSNSRRWRGHPLDLSSLGVALWVMVTGQTPFRGPSAEVMFQHQHAPLPLERLKAVPQP